MKGRATILDIAKVAGVSAATVSRVLNGVDYPVRPQLRERILQVSKELHYTPNIFGKMLKVGKTNDIGIIIPTLINPFYAQTVSGVERECRKMGYNPIFCSSYNEPEKERAYIDLLLQKCVEGILISTVNEDPGVLNEALKKNPNIVLFDQQIDGVDCDSISFDFYEAGMLSARYLLQKGHRDIAFLTAPFTRRSRRSIFAGFQLALKNGGLSFDKSRLFVHASDVEYSDSIDEFENGRVLARQFLKAKCPATAIVTINDITAFGIISGLISGGVRVPEDVSIIGFDDISVSTMVNPPLTTINQPSYETGRLAAHMLIDKIERDVRMNSRVLLKPTVVERSSVKTVTPVVP